MKIYYYLTVGHALWFRGSLIGQHCKNLNKLSSLMIRMILWDDRVAYIDWQKFYSIVLFVKGCILVNGWM